MPLILTEEQTMLQDAADGFLNVVLVVCFAVGAYFTWFGYFAPAQRRT